MLLEKRPVTLPRRCGILRQGTADRRKNLGRLPNNLIDQVERKKPDNPKNAPQDDGSLPVERAGFSGLSPEIPNPAMYDRCHVIRSPQSTFYQFGYRLTATIAK